MVSCSLLGNEGHHIRRNSDQPAVWVRGSSFTLRKKARSVTQVAQRQHHRLTLVCTFVPLSLFFFFSLVSHLLFRFTLVRTSQIRLIAAGVLVLGCILNKSVILLPYEDTNMECKGALIPQ